MFKVASVWKNLPSSLYCKLKQKLKSYIRFLDHYLHRIQQLNIVHFKLKTHLQYLNTYTAMLHCMSVCCSRCYKAQGFVKNVSGSCMWNKIFHCMTLHNNSDNIQIMKMKWPKSIFCLMLHDDEEVSVFLVQDEILCSNVVH